MTGNLLHGWRVEEYGRSRDGVALRAFFPEVTVAFEIDDASRHYHVPVLLSPFAFSTYRGS